MMHFQEIVVHAAVTPKQIAIVLYIFASVLYPIKVETNNDTATQVNTQYKIRNTLKICCNIIDTETIAITPMIYAGLFHSNLYESR